MHIGLFERINIYRNAVSLNILPLVRASNNICCGSRFSEIKNLLPQQLIPRFRSNEDEEKYFCS